MKLKTDDRVYLNTKSGGKIAMNNLRPGDWIGMREDTRYYRYLVLQNSAVMQRLEAMYPDYSTEALPHSILSGDLYIGRGKKRWWYDRLPRFLKRHFMPYSKPE